MSKFKMWTFIKKIIINKQREYLLEENKNQEKWRVICEGGRKVKTKQWVKV